MTPTMARMLRLSVIAVAQVASAPVVPWVVFAAAMGALTGSLSAYYGLRLKIQANGGKAMRAESEIRLDVKQLREESDRRHEELNERSKFTLRLVADVARKMKVDGIDEKVIEHLTSDTG